MEEAQTFKGEVQGKKEVPVLLVSVLIIAVCGILYELLISTISTYFLGSSILHFSITIGLFLSSMGIGSFFSRFINNNLLERFIWVEIALGIVGGLSALILHASFSLTENYYLTAFILIVILGAFIGIEIPLITRILKNYEDLKNTISNVLAFDYIGSLVASVMFPLILLPYLGLMRTSFLVGILNLLIAVFNTSLFKKNIKNATPLMLSAIGSIAVMIVGMAYSFQLSGMLEQYVYEDNIIFSRQTEYQRVVVTKYDRDVRLYINGNLQFSTIDEYRYHEPLVHVPMAYLPQAENVLLLGAGDGLATRELLKYDEIKSIDLVDLDPVITEIASTNPIFTKYNNGALQHPKVNVVHDDAFNFIQNSGKVYSLIIIDLPDPNSPSLGKLYSKEFYQMIQQILAKDGVVITQSTSPYFAANAFWCINKTMEAVFGGVLPINVYLPTFGMWGFNICFQTPKKAYFDDKKPVVEELIKPVAKHLDENKNRLQNRFLTSDILPKIFVFEKDMQASNVEINRLDNQALVKYYENSWGKWD
ncbi:polyamine aminopropyltransferase [Chondrinema litorale]|uniref:polyamine aminopropyltransferase n=1 Tax=Chondrinema litorale TaxID=2994555 RepID=UPI002544C8DF|nr:polyamine aminopropyltransferase [Chondrinema litorale]UZR92520.1 polyamine aminopropyltransferase [Chondrinema litorale]